MAWVVILSIIALPVVEIAIFLKVTDLVGILPTVAGAVLAGFAGVALWRTVGGRTLMRARDALARGEMPVDEVFDGLCILAAGILLLLPGFLSDVVALILLLPPVRLLLRRWMGRRMVVAAGPRMRPGSAEPRGPEPGRVETVVIDADYHEIGEERPPKL
jgi:UPF0716 protein FxsA